MPFLMTYGQCHIKPHDLLSQYPFYAIYINGYKLNLPFLKVSFFKICSRSLLYLLVLYNTRTSPFSIAFRISSLSCWAAVFVVTA